MNFSAIFIRRPIATSLLMLGIALFGVIAYSELPVSDLPSVDYPTITVSASLPGADPSTMASSVATPLERQFTTIAGIDSMVSVNALGSTQITLQFDIGRGVDGAAVDVQTAIAEAMPLLPAGMPNPPSFRKVNPADQPIMMLGISSKTLPPWVVDEYAETTIAQRISTINGVAQVQVMGSQKYAIHVQVDPEKLNAMQLGINEVASALQNWNVNLPTGTLWGEHQAFSVQSNGQLMNAAAYRPMVVAFRNGTPVRLEQIANVKDTVEDERTVSWMYTANGANKAINLMIMRQPGSNVIEVNDAIRKLLPSLSSQLPPSLLVEIRMDRSQTIRSAFKDIQFTMAATLALVIGVIFVFLRNASATLIPSLALPFSLFGTFAVMYVLHYSMDTLSMMALILSIGFVVDDAIVMLENIVRHVERGESPLEASYRGSREISFTIVSMTLSLAAVFIPILFMSGMLGKLFREFAVTITVAILISGFVSVTLTPMLCSRLLSHRAKTKRGIFYRTTESFFKGMLGVYDVSLRWVLKHRPVMGVVFLGVLIATAYLYVLVPKGFIPETDIDQLSLMTEVAQGTSFLSMARAQQRIGEVLRKDPNVDTFMMSAGGSMYGMGTTTSRAFIQLKPRRERKLTALEVVNELRPKISGFPGVRAFMSLPPAIRIGGRGSKSSYEFTLQGPDTRALYREGSKLEREIAKLPSVLDVNSDLAMRNPRVNIIVDRDRAASLGLNAQEISQSIYDGYGQSWVTTIYAPTNQFHVVMEVLPRYQNFTDSLSLLYLKGSNGQLVPLESVTKRVEDVGPQSINHSGQLPSVTVSFALKPGHALGEAVAEINELAASTLPANITTSFTGTAKVFQDSLKNLSVLLVIAIMVVYIVLGVLYESFIHPLTILSGLPSAGFGALLTLMIFHVDLSIYAFVGMIMLIGIVKKNAIMQIDFALDAERTLGKSPADAIYEGCITRFRPIMMTTMAALFGALPMALGWGSGGEARRPLGLAVAGGLVFSQMITLYLTPVVYTYMAALKDWRSRGKSGVAQGASPGAVVRPMDATS